MNSSGNSHAHGPADARGDLLQVIDPDGRITGSAEIGVPAADLKRIYDVMVRIRVLEEKGMNLQRSGKIGFYIGCAGQEATHLGAVCALRDADWVFPQYREPGIPLWRGVTIQEMVHQLFANAKDPVRGHQMPCHYAFAKARYVSISSPIGTQIIQAVGAAVAAQILKDGNVVMTFFGDGATSANDFHTGMNFAGVFKAPVVLICQNNQYAISLPVEKQTASETIAMKAAAYGFAGVRVDGNDVLAVHRASREAVDRARAGGGPTLIEAVTYRMGPHSSSDDPKRYRDTAEVKGWQKRDPIDRFRHFLEIQGLMTADEAKVVREAAEREVTEAIRAAERLPPPPLESLVEDVYAEVPWHLREQIEDIQRLVGSRGAKDLEKFPL